MMAWWLVSLCVWGAERRRPLGRRTHSLNMGVQSRSWAGVNTRPAQVTQSSLAAAQHSEGGRPHRAYILNELPLESTVITAGAQKLSPDACVCPLHSEGVGLALQERTKAPDHWLRQTHVFPLRVWKGFPPHVAVCLLNHEHLLSTNCVRPRCCALRIAWEQDQAFVREHQ